MKRARTIGAAAALAAAAGGCGTGGDAPAVAGRWERVGQPAEWVEFRADGSFAARSFMGTDTVRGVFRQSGDTVHTRSEYDRGGPLVLHGDTLLVMGDGTRFRRVSR